MYSNGGQLGFVQTERLKSESRGMQEICAPPLHNCLTAGTRDVKSLETSHQPSLHCILLFLPVNILSRLRQ